VQVPYIVRHYPLPTKVKETCDTYGRIWSPIFQYHRSGHRDRGGPNQRRKGLVHLQDQEEQALLIMTMMLMMMNLL